MSRIEENFAEKDSEKIRQEVEERFFRLNKAFIWTPMNTEKIKNLILEINRKMNSLYDKVQILKQDFDSGAEKGIELYKDYIIEGSLLYEPHQDLSDVTPEQMQYLSEYGIKGQRNIYASHQKIEDRANQLFLGKDVNWNTDIFDRPEFKHIPVCYYVNSVFFQSKTYSLQDMLYMENDEFKYHIEVYFDPES
ncbi:MAG: hypothetical protein II631_05645 [Treponema sp.]|nr:hypothetical protein [Treponema sp.]HAM78049.1 hypothetical protein [Treponema sp.]